MSKGIRSAVNAKFVELLPQRAELTNKGFRQTIIAFAVQEFAISVASAATHYNHAFQVAKTTNPAAVEGLGRAPEKNNGGRKKGSKNAVTDPLAAEAAVADASAPAETPAQPAAEAAPAEPTVELWNVAKKSTGEIVATGLTEEAATAMVEAAKRQKKAALILSA